MILSRLTLHNNSPLYIHKDITLDDNYNCCVYILIVEHLLRAWRATYDCAEISVIASITSVCMWLVLDTRIIRKQHGTLCMLVIARMVVGSLGLPQLRDALLGLYYSHVLLMGIYFQLIL